MSLPSYSLLPSNHAGHSGDLQLGPLPPPFVHRDPLGSPEAAQTNPTPACLPASTCHVYVALHTSSDISPLHLKVGYGTIEFLCGFC